jgi:hypothetical protein
MNANATPTSTHALLQDGGEASEWLRDPREPPEWSSVIEHLELSTATYWLATVDRDRNPQVRPIMAVWMHGELHFSSGAATRQAKNLALGPHCAVAQHRARAQSLKEGARRDHGVTGPRKAVR